MSDRRRSLTLGRVCRELGLPPPPKDLAGFRITRGGRRDRDAEERERLIKRIEALERRTFPPENHP
jgi:hypothetical protein